MRNTLILMLIQVLLIKSLKSQQTTNQTVSISLTPLLKSAPADCTDSQYFDNVELQCKSCPQNSQTSTSDKSNCRCLSTHYFNYNNGGGSVECRECPANQVQSIDGFSCIVAPNLPGCDDTGNSYESDTNEDGTSLNQRRCVACNLQSSISLSSSCKGCRPYVFIEDAEVNINSIDCSQKYNVPIGGFYFLTATADGQPNYFRCPFDSSSVAGAADCADSWYLSSFSPAAYRTCRLADRRNRTSCQQLANMCVLNLYGYSSGSALDRIDVCKVFDRIYEADDVDMPWLRYPESYGEFKALYLLNGIDSEYLKIKFPSKCKLTPELNLYSSEYTVDGKLTRFGRFDISKLQLCNLVSNLAQSSTRSPFSLTYLKQSCSLSLATLFDLADTSSFQTPFYDMFVEYGNNGDQLFPVPVKILNYKAIDSGSEVNRGANENNHQHQRRFFLYETVSSKDSPNGRSTHIRYAKSISIVVDLISGKSDGEIYPPVITVEYATARRDLLTSNPSAIVDVSFSIEYRMEINSFMLAVYISLGVLGLLAFFWTCVRLWNWNRRSGRYACDLITLFKFLLYLCNSIANSIFIIIVAATLYWLIIYRGQTVAFLFLPSDSQEFLFAILISVAFALKLIDVFHVILLQCSYDIFFIDWERPKANADRDPEASLVGGSMTRPILPPIRPPTAAGKKPGVTAVQMDKPMKDALDSQNMVSCWRTLFVANEWNELQAYRKTSITLQLVFALFLLKVINLEELALKDCSQNLFKDINEYRAPFSLVLRVAIASSVLIGIWIAQSLIYALIYSRFVEDKLGQFVDFCSISNISMFIMTHSQYGYYVHGRSPHGNADASMQKMTEALVREENDLTAKRGLENGSDHQTFSMAVPIKLTRQYFKVMRPLYERNTRSAIRRDQLTSSNEFEKRMVAYTQLNKFLMSFINNALRDLNYIVVYRNFMENILGVEFRVPIDCGYFYRDDLTCFASTVFFGKERTLFVFDLLLFLFVDCFTQSYILAAFIVYIVSNFLTVIRADLGKRNISKKTLVDKRFLI